VLFFFFFSSGPKAYAPDATQPVGLLCYPSVLDVLTFAASPSPRPCYPRELELRGRESWPIILPKCTTSTSLLDSFTCRKARHGTDGFTSSPKEGVLRIFSPLKIRRLRPGLNQRT
jgi:hypothetical protein